MNAMRKLGDRVGPEVWAMRVDQATCYRLANSPEGHRPIGMLEWPALLRKLDQIGTPYKN